MGDYKRDSEQDNSMDCPIWGTDDISDEELLKEFEAVKNMAVPLPIPSPSPDEFEKIWARIQEERAELKNVPESDQPEHPKVIKPRFGWKRLAAIGLIACLVAGSGCMVAMGTKSYFYREKELGDSSILVNDANNLNINGEDEAYTYIRDEVGVSPLKFGYIPAQMSFLGMEYSEGFAKLSFSYENEVVYFIQSKFEKKVSYDYNTDATVCQTIHNKWINKDFKILKEETSSGEDRYETEVIVNGCYYRLFGFKGKEEFVKMVERLTF